MRPYRLLLLILMSVAAASCSSRKQPGRTSVEIVDNYRHYYPIVRGETIELVYEIKNVGEHELILNDIITTCGCIRSDSKNSLLAVPAGTSRMLKLKYDSSKNAGYVRHYITIYGNFATTDKMDLVFDVNVVPGSDEMKDYEELYQEKMSKSEKFLWWFTRPNSYKRYYLDVPGE